jgi:hypothetical protein
VKGFAFCEVAIVLKVRINQPGSQPMQLQEKVINLGSLQLGRRQAKRASAQASSPLNVDTCN